MSSRGSVLVLVSVRVGGRERTATRSGARVGLAPTKEPHRRQAQRHLRCKLGSRVGVGVGKLYSAWGQSALAAREIGGASCSSGHEGRWAGSPSVPQIPRSWAFSPATSPSPICSQIGSWRRELQRSLSLRPGPGLRWSRLVSRHADSCHRGARNVEEGTASDST